MNRVIVAWEGHPMAGSADEVWSREAVQALDGTLPEGCVCPISVEHRPGGALVALATTERSLRDLWEEAGLWGWTRVSLGIEDSSIEEQVLWFRGPKLTRADTLRMMTGELEAVIGGPDPGAEAVSWTVRSEPEFEMPTEWQALDCALTRFAEVEARRFGWVMDPEYQSWVAPVSSMEVYVCGANDDVRGPLTRWLAEAQLRAMAGR